MKWYPKFRQFFWHLLFVFLSIRLPLKILTFPRFSGYRVRPQAKRRLPCIQPGFCSPAFSADDPGYRTAQCTKKCSCEQGSGQDISGKIPGPASGCQKTFNWGVVPAVALIF